MGYIPTGVNTVECGWIKQPCEMKTNTTENYVTWVLHRGTVYLEGYTRVCCCCWFVGCVLFKQAGVKCFQFFFIPENGLISQICLHITCLNSVQFSSVPQQSSILRSEMTEPLSSPSASCSRSHWNLSLFIACHDTGYFMAVDLSARHTSCVAARPGLGW